MDACRDTVVRRINGLPAGQGKSATGPHHSTELQKCGQRWLGELHRVHAHQSVGDARGQPGGEQCPDLELRPAGRQ